MTDILIAKLIALLEWKFIGYSCSNNYFDYLRDRPYEIIMEAKDEINEFS